MPNWEMLDEWLYCSSSDTHVRRVDDLVGRWVGKDSLGVDTSLVGEGRETGDVVVEWNVDLDVIGNHVLDLLEQVEVVLALDVFTVGDDHPGHQTTKWGNTVALTNTNDRSVDVGGTGLKGAVSVGNGASRVVVEMALNVARDDTTECPDEVVDLSWRSATDSICDTDTVDTNLVNSLVKGKEIDKV